MPGETAPRGGNAFHAKGKGKGKGKGKSKGKFDKGKGRGHGQKRTHDGNAVSISSDLSLSSFAYSASNSSPNAWSTGSSFNPGGVGGMVGKSCGEFGLEVGEAVSAVRGGEWGWMVKAVVGAWS